MEMINVLEKNVSEKQLSGQIKKMEDNYGNDKYVREKSIKKDC